MTACLTGLRRGELLGLRWDDVDFNSQTIFVRHSLFNGKLTEPKSHSSKRKVRITDSLLNELRIHQARQLVELKSNNLNLVFPNSEGRPRDGKNFVSRVFLPTVMAAGLRRIRFHDIRHSYASALIAQGENIKFIQAVMGHSSITVTMNTYTHLLPDAGEQAAKKLDSLVLGSEENVCVVVK